MRKIFVTVILILFTINPKASYAEIDTTLKASVRSKIYNTFDYKLLLNNKHQGYFNTQAMAEKAAKLEVQRKTASVIQIFKGKKETFYLKQYRRARTHFNPWNIEILPNTKAIHFTVSWEGDAEIALIAPNGKRLSQKDFGTLYPNILSYNQYEGEDLVILNPPAGVWQVWVFGKFKNAQLSLPKFDNFFYTDVSLTQDNRQLNFASSWDNSLVEDAIPAKFFLSDPKGKLYPMGSFHPNISSEYTGYNGLAIEVLKVQKGIWKLMTFTSSPKIQDINYKVLDSSSKLNFITPKIDTAFQSKVSPLTKYPQEEPVDILLGGSIIPVNSLFFNFIGF